MNRILCTLAVAATLAGVWAASRAIADDTPATAPSTAPAPKAEALNFKMKNIDGQDVDLEQYVGKVVMIVNVASKCGNTPQYEPMEAMYKKYKEKGFVILGFPANNFAGQEPGTDAQIKEFCEKTYQVEFPMFAKTSVKGGDINSLYKYLTAQETKPAKKGDITWNFEKFLLGRDGKILARFAPATKPDDATVVKAVEDALAAK